MNNGEVHYTMQKEVPFEDGDRIAYVEDEIEMTVRIGDDKVWFEKETSPVGVSLIADSLKKKENQRRFRLDKLESLKRHGWEKVN